MIWGFPKIRVTFLGVPIIKSRVFGGLYWVPPILGNYHLCWKCVLRVQLEVEDGVLGFREMCRQTVGYLGPK